MRSLGKALSKSRSSDTGDSDPGLFDIPGQIRKAIKTRGSFPDEQAATKLIYLALILLAITFIPFLVYFMLTWKDHAHASTVRLFPKEHRLIAHRTVGRISTMIRSFIAGNVLVGLVSAVLSTVVFWRLGIPYFYFLGVISGFVSLVPYLGVFLALLPPLAAGMGVVDKKGVGIILITVVGLHVLSMNVLYPKIVGKRLRLNPLAVTLSLLFWAWIWGAMGLILAVPLVGATKIVCDYIDPLRGFGAWLGD